MNILLRLTFLTLTLGLGLTGSLQAARYKQSKQKQFSHEYMKNGVSVKYTEITSQESKKRLGHSFKPRRGSESIIPLEIKITNHSSSGVKFSKDDLDLKLVSLNEVKAYAEHQAKIGGMCGVGCSVLLAPFVEVVFVLIAVSIFAILSSVVTSLSTGLAIGIPLAILSTLAITAAPATLGCWNYRKTQKIVRNKILTPYVRFDIDYIAPNKTLTQVVYVKRKDLP